MGSTSHLTALDWPNAPGIMLIREMQGASAYKEMAEELTRLGHATSEPAQPRNNIISSLLAYLHARKLADGN